VGQPAESDSPCPFPLTTLSYLPWHARLALYLKIPCVLLSSLHCSPPTPPPPWPLSRLTPLTLRYKKMMLAQIIGTGLGAVTNYFTLVEVIDAKRPFLDGTLVDPAGAHV
jgi:hypothetical protein